MVNIITIRPFLTKPEQQLHLAEIARSLEQPHPTVRLWLNALEKKGVLKKSHKGRQTLYQLNKDHPNLIDYIVMAEKHNLIEKCEKELILGELTHFIQTTFSEDTKALFFGSAVDNLKEANDIDILVIGEINEQSVHAFCRRFKKPVHIVSVKHVHNVTLSLREEIFKKNLMVKGSEEFVRWLIHGNNQMVQKTEKRNKTHRAKRQSRKRVHPNSGRDT
jgi:predicted transcriptional regulator